MSLYISVEREDDGRWIGEVPDLPELFAYGATRGEALDRVKALALRVIADRLERGDRLPYLADMFSVAHTPLATEPTSSEEPLRLFQE